MGPHYGNRSSASVLGHGQEGSGMLCAGPSATETALQLPTANCRGTAGEFGLGGSLPGHRVQSPAENRVRQDTSGSLCLIIISLTWCHMNWIKTKKSVVLRYKNVQTDSRSCAGFITISFCVKGYHM